jgi:hypothetical protein
MSSTWQGRALFWQAWREGKRPGYVTKPRGLRAGEPVQIARARQRVTQEIKTLETNSPATLFDELRLMALRQAKEILLLPNTLEDFAGDMAERHKRLTLQAHMAESIISDAIKIDDQALRHQERQDTLSLIRDRLASLKLPDKPE